MTLGQKLKEIRLHQRLSLGDVANNAAKFKGVENPQRAVIWRIEKGSATPRIGTLRAVCAGLGIKKDSDQWKEIHALWVATKFNEPISAKELVISLGKSRWQGMKSFERFMNTIAKLSEDDFEEVVKAVERPTVLAGIRGLNTIYESKR